MHPTRCKTGHGVWAHKQRMGDAEGVIGELKNRHGLDRVRSRGTPLFHLQLLLGCTALNCKRLADHVPETARVVAGAPRATPSDLEPAAAGTPAAARRTPSPADQAPARADGASASTWTYTICLN